MRAALLAWWDGLDDAERSQWTGVAAAIGLFCVNYILWSPWLIEDAAISYSYALHAATGEGWVTYPGGERVEGFSNPTWTALLATTRLVGISPWLAAKWYGLLFGTLTLPIAFLWAREVTGDRGWIPVLAPLWLAVSPQFTTWVASGLENPLWVWLLALGSWSFLREIRGGGPSWSAVPMGLLAITRPEGPLYVAAMAFTGVGLTLKRPRVVARIAVWAVTCAGIWGAYELYRYLVFGWPLPNTYYAKLHVGRDKFQPFHWGVPGNVGLGWTYLRSWAAWSTWGFLLPLLPLAATGLQGWRRQLGLGTGAILALVLIPGAAWLVGSPWWPLAAEPEGLVQARVGLLCFVGIALPWFGLGRRGDHARILAWMLVATLFCFVVYVGADWMQGHRWLNLAVVPLSVLLADAVHTWCGVHSWEKPRAARRWIAVTVAGFPIVAGVTQTIHILSPTETSPFDVGRRAAYMNGVQERLHVDHATHFDVDMGANMWWSGDAIVDVAGLVDVPMAQHHWQREFVREYVLRERRPHFMHSHGQWRSTSGMGAQPVFNRDWLKISDFVAGPGVMHVGNHVRRDLFIRPRWSGPSDPVVFDDRVRLEGLRIPSPVVPVGGTVYVELGWRPMEDNTEPFRPFLVFSRGDLVHATELPPAYDWVDTRRWRRSEVVHGFHSIRLPEAFEPGQYTVSLVLVDDEGVLQADRATSRPVFARGELRLDQPLEVAPLDTVLAKVEGNLNGLREHAEGDRCVRAEDSMKLARRHLPADHPEQPWSDQANHIALARCWASRAESSPVETAEAAIARARQWNHRDATVVAVGRRLADTWEADGEQAWTDGRAGAAYAAWRRTLAADPTRSRVRVKAEEARDVRLGLDEESNE